MIVRSIEELENIKKSIAPEILNNRAFNSIFTYEVERPLREGLQEDIRVSEDGKKIMMVSDVKTLRNNDLPKSIAYAHEIELKENGNIETTNSYGELYDANPYYSNRNERPYYNVSAVLNTTYRHTVYDKEGIELAHGHYYKNDYGLNDIIFDDAKKFKVQLLSNGFHKPASWRMGEPDIPLYASDKVYVNGVNRSPDNPALATTFSFNIEPVSKFRKNVRYGYAYVHTEYPERIRIDEYNIYALNYGNGKYELKDEYKERYPGLDVDQVTREISLACEEYFERSNSNRYNNGFYPILKERLDKANEQYKKSINR